jgi:NADP-dependent 3-hydroxy acid dehydrogenase YdfG
MDTTALSGRTALVTGAASGIGAATAARLARAGARVALVARRADRLGPLAAEIGATAVPADITAPGAAAALRERVGEVDLLVNNAAVMLPNPLLAGKDTEWRRMLELNLAALLEVTRAFLPGLVGAAEAGRAADVVNVSSTGAGAATPAFAVYGATKAAVSHLSAALRAELAATGLRVTDLRPGGTDTELLEHATHPGIRARMAVAAGSGTLLAADDVADAVLYAVTRPRHVCVTGLTVTPVGQPG